MGGHPINLRADPGSRVIRISRAGWSYIILTIFLGFSAVNTGNNLVYLIVAALLSFMGISGIFGKRNLSKIDIEIEFPKEVYAKTAFPVKVALRNNRRFLPAFLIRVHLPGSEILFPFEDARAEGVKYASLTFEERGPSVIGDVRISSVFPFNFFVRYRRINRSFETIVFPQVKRCDLSLFSERERRPRGEQPAERTGYDSDIISVRDYIKGDPIKYIHWKASARTGRLKTKELSSLSHQPVIIDFDAAPVRDVEERLSCVTYAILTLFKQNVPVGIKISGAFYRPFSGTSGERGAAGKTEVLRRLALYGKE